MRILIPAKYYPDSFEDNVQATLLEMGHEVRTLGFVGTPKKTSWIMAAIRIADDLVFKDKLTSKENQLLRLAADFKPDLLLSTTGMLSPTALYELGKLVPGRRILWWGDPPANSLRWGLLDPGWDFIYIKDNAAVAKLKLIGRNAFLLHEAMNPAKHRPVSGQRTEDLVFAGNYYAFRQAVILRLLRDGFGCQLYGPRPPRWSHPLIKERHSGRYIVGEEKSRIFGESLACINTFSLAEGDSLNCRAFEIAGAGALQLIEYRSAIAQCFDLGKELLAFTTYEELLDHIQRAIKHPEEMLRIRKAAAARALAHHTYRHRLGLILKNL